MITLPTDILITIAAYLDLSDLRRFFKVCRRLKELDSKRLWVIKMQQLDQIWELMNRPKARPECYSPLGGIPSYRRKYIDGLTILHEQLWFDIRTSKIPSFYIESIDACDKEVVEILMQRLWSGRRFELIKHMIDSNNIYIFTLACRHISEGIYAGELTDYAIYTGERNNISMIKYLTREYRYPISIHKIMDRVALTDNLELMKYLEDIRIAWYQGSYIDIDAVRNVIDSSASTVFSWILQNLQYEESPKFRREFTNLIDSTSMGRSDKNRLRALLEYADRHQMKLDLSTPLSNAIYVSRADIVKMLCKHGAKITPWVQKKAGYKMDAIRSCMKPEWFDCT